MPFCETNGIKTYYETLGEGDPLVLIPGLTSDSSFWIKMFTNPLQEEFQLILYDPRCTGKSDHPTEEFSMKDLATDLKELLDYLEISKANLYGLSMGSAVAQRFMIDYPDRVNRVILVASTPSMDYFSDEGLELVNNYRKGDDDYVEDTMKVYEFLLEAEQFAMRETFLREMLKQNQDKVLQTPEAYRNQLRAALNAEDTSENLKQVEHPVLILKPGKDRLVDPQASEKLFELLPNAEIIRYETASHGLLPPMTNMDLKPLVDFLKN